MLKTTATQVRANKLLQAFNGKERIGGITQGLFSNFSHSWVIQSLNASLTEYFHLG